MWLVTARDLQFRARRFIIAIAVTSLVFGIALAIDGMRRSVQHEIPAIVANFDADQWVTARGASGPFTTTRVIDAATADAVSDSPGVHEADAVVLSRTVSGSGDPADANLVGHVVGGLGAPPISEGHAARTSGEAVVSPGITVDVGDDLQVGGETFRVVGKTAGGRYYFGIPTVFVPLEDAQDIVFHGQDLAMGVAVKGHLDTPPPDMRVLDNSQVESDLRRPLAGGVQSLVVTAVLMWLIAAGIIGLIVYLSALERLRDFAVFKATGAPTRIIVGGLMLQSVIVSVLAAALAIPVSKLVGFGLPFPSKLGVQGLVQMLAIAVVVGLLASLAGVRSALTTDPAAAFGGN